MRLNLLSPEAVTPCLHLIYVTSFLRENLRRMNKDMFVALFDNLIETIRELDALLTNVQVRTHGNRKMSRPRIGEKPTLENLLKRLDRQVDTAAELADSCFVGPPANAVETETMAGVATIMKRLHDRTLPGRLPIVTSGHQSTSSYNF